MSTAIRQYPTASHTFSVYRKMRTTPAQAPMSQPPVVTGLSIALKDMQDTIIVEEGEPVFTGVYTGATFANANLVIGDLLADEAEVERDGSPVRYSVEGITRYSFYTKAHLKRLFIGI